VWRRIRRTLYVTITVGFLGPVLAFFITYLFVHVPDPTALAAGLNQPVTLYYADGSTMYSKTTQTSHRLVTWAQIPQSMKNAQMAAEDETFMTNAGFDLKAIVRTVWNRLHGGSGGGSTIGQEYIKKATGNDQATLSRKFLEMVQSYKLTNTYSKQDILTAYLNTVYFGRGAYGIQAAARAFYGENVSQLSNEQAALLAGMVQLPSYANSATYQHQRYAYVMGRMLANHWISRSEYSTAQFPTPLPEQASGSGGTSLSPTRQYIVTEVFNELAQKGYSEQQLSREGAKIYTTISPTAQTDAEQAVTKIMAADTQYPDEAAALVSVNPSTGGIIAYYGGTGATSYDLAMTPQQPGSSFKPYVFTAALQTQPQQIGLDTVYNGSDNQTIDGQLIHNAPGDSLSQATVKQAMTKSINTVFYRMGAQVGTAAIQNAAWAAGVPKRITSSLGYTYDSLQQDDPATGKGTGQTRLGIAIGQYPVRPIDQAQGYATFADNGNYIPAHFVSKVTTGAGGTVYQFNTPATPAFSTDPATNAEIARTVTQSMTDVASSSGDGLVHGRPNAAKTGTAQYLGTSHDSEAWMVGFTPQVATAVWFGNDKAPQPIYGNYHNTVGASHGYDVYGREEPGYIWQDFMNTYLANQPSLPFPTGTILHGSGTTPTTSTPPPVTTSSAPPTTTRQPPTTVPPTTTSVPPPCVLGCPPTSSPPTTSGRRHAQGGSGP
jgi:membrane peptidoglycan carboxypeptidase